ncbi:hypothetical protein QR680_007326 [Steinernema hermaphroditum]|uniref:receptor protein-tyrosine kinase n=1 Tax=Steinernema hermaphroditum TaxID=289476 RepID=A0AA39IF22_9BILA|nr:hypothetical protein QR680_007326 [Steinernema hermaphroditum]
MHAAHRRNFFAPTTLPFLFLVTISLAEEVREKRCGSVHIRTQKSTFFRSFTKDDDLMCTVIEGDLSITIFRDADYSRYVFPHLREITGYLLIYNYVGLTSLQETFPVLRVIGGENLVMNYALVLYRNPDLEDAAFENLTLIKNGGVWITENPKLCDTRHINWSLFTNLRTAPIRIDEEEILKKCRSEPCREYERGTCARNNGRISCWTQKSCQKRCMHARYENQTIGPGCDPTGKPCHYLCVGGCSRTNDPGACFSCRKVLRNNVCADRCPDGQFELQNRRCISRQECYALAPIRMKEATLYWKILGDRCHFECPQGTEQSEHDPNQCVKCDGSCLRMCDADYTINTLSDARDMRECDVVSGNLVIDLGVNMLSHELLRDAFSRISEVRGYFMIRFSNAFTNFDVFGNLHRIGGKTLYRDRYALAVFENYNLRKAAFPRSIDIRNGSVMFHNNRLLCYREIVKFLGRARLKEEVSEFDVSSLSNGEKALCVKPNLKVMVDKIFSNGFVVVFPNFNATDTDHRDFLGHQIFYKAATDRKARLSYEEEEACDSSWNMEFVPPMLEDEDRSAFVGESGQVLPNTLYAFYVKTRMTKGQHQNVSISPIFYVKTLFAEPTAPVGLKAISTEPAEMEITWSPPLAPNGEITHYVLKWRIERPKEEKIYDYCYFHELTETKFSFAAGLEEVDSEANATCPAIPGCCNCGDGKASQPVLTLDSFVESESSKMENQIQNLVFIDRKRRKRQIIQAIIDLHGPEGRLREEGNATRTFDAIRNMTEMYEVDPIATEGFVNVTGTQLTLKNLYHFTNYRITCSKTTKTAIWTLPEPSMDIINASTIEHLDAEQQNRSRLVIRHADRLSIFCIFLCFPYITVSSAAMVTHSLNRKFSIPQGIEYCVTAAEFEDNQGAFTKNFALEGDWYLEIRTVTTFGVSGPSRAIVVHFPTNSLIFVWIGLSVALVLVCASVAAVVILYKTRHRMAAFDCPYPEFYAYEAYKPDDWELDMDQFVTDKKIGQGSFGDVYLFKTKVPLKSHTGHEFTKCAGKVLKLKPTQMQSKYERDKFLAEGSMMKTFNATFVVKLYGIVSKCNPPMVVMEYMDRGNLRDYLRICRPKVEGLIHMKKPAKKHLLWAAQIADGMSYLHSMSFCHRDLAARNILVSEEETVKIGDFGLSRELGMHDYYRPDSARQLPIRWMAPEALQDGTSTVQSDVWSYSIVLYEILTYGSIPYVGFANDEVKRRVVSKRLAIELPGEVPREWEALVKACAQHDADERPTFPQIIKYLKNKLKDEQFERDSFVVNNEFSAVKPYPFRKFEGINQLREDQIPPSLNLKRLFPHRNPDELDRRASSWEHLESTYLECETDNLLGDMAARAQSF